MPIRSTFDVIVDTSVLLDLAIVTFFITSERTSRAEIIDQTTWTLSRCLIFSIYLPVSIYC